MHDAKSAGYQIFMLALCLYALGALAIQSSTSIEPGTREILDYADFIVCGLFFADFVGSLVRAPNRKRYLLTWGWLDLLSSIPMIDAVRWGRAARVVRVFRVLRALRATKLLAELFLRGRVQNAFLVASLLALLLLIFSSIAVLHFETGAEANIKSPEDAIWWSFATITTVGYGDRYPTTSEGRFIAGILMSAGVGLFGIFSGFLASWFIGPEIKQEETDLMAEIRGLREEVVQLRRQLTNGDSHESS